MSKSMSMMLILLRLALADPVAAEAPGDVSVSLAYTAEAEVSYSKEQMAPEPTAKPMAKPEALSTEPHQPNDEALREEADPVATRLSKTTVAAQDPAVGALLNSLEVYKEIGRLLSKDPVVLTVTILSFAYCIAKMLIGKKVQPSARASPKGGSPATTYRKPPRAAAAYQAQPAAADRAGSWRSEARPTGPPADAPKRVQQKRGKSQIAIQVNQQLMRLDTASEVLDCALAYTGQTDVVNIVTAIHRCAKIAASKNRKELANDARVVKLLDQLEEFLQQEQPRTILTRAVGNTSWALAKMQFSNGDACHPVLDTMQSLFVKYSTEFKPEELMNTVWAFAELRRESKEGQARALEVAKAAVAYSDRFTEFTLQQVVYFSWALGRLSGIACVRSHPEVRKGLAEYMEKIVGRVQGGLRTLTAKNLAMTAWGITHLDMKVSSGANVKGLLDEIATEAVRRGLATFSPGDASSIAWALNKSHATHETFYQTFREHLLTAGLEAYSNQDAANVISMYVIRAYQDDDKAFLQMLAESTEKLAKNFSRLERVMVHWAFSQVNYPMPNLEM